MTWELVWDVDREYLHILPVGDIYEHDANCICGTRVEPIVGEGRKVAGWLVVHQSLDGREYEEDDYVGEPMPVEPENTDL